MVATVDDRTILVKIHREFYSIPWEVLEQVFAPFGVIEYIEVFCPGEEFHSKIRFKSRESAIEALEGMNRRDVYDGCCQLELFLEANLMEDNLRRNESLRQKVQQLATATDEFLTNSIQNQEAQRKLLAESKRSTETFQEKAEQWLSKIDRRLDELTESIKNLPEDDQFPVLTETKGKDGASESYGNASSIRGLGAGDNEQNIGNAETNDTFEEHQVRPEIVEVNSNPSKAVIFDVASKEYRYLLTEGIGVKSDDVKMISVETFENLIAPKVFVEMSAQVELAFVAAAAIVRHEVQAIKMVFDPGIVEICTKINKILKTSAPIELQAKLKCGNVSQGRVQAQEIEIVGSVGLAQYFEANSGGLAAIADEIIGRLGDRLRCRNAMPYDRGKESSVTLQVQLGFWKPTADLKIVVILIFDPGGSDKIELDASCLKFVAWCSCFLCFLCSAGYSKMLQLLHKCLPLGLRAPTCYRITCMQHFIRQLLALALIDPLRVKSRDRFYTQLVGFVGLMVYHILDGNVIFDAGGEHDSCMAFSSCPKKILIAVLHGCHAELQWVVVPGIEDIGLITRDHGGCKIHDSLDCLLLEGFNEVG